ncbi:MAG: mandelate racemase [Proteobacteria bacterium]|nr:mandelate racemase [Burkholderiales bacterium]
MRAEYAATDPVPGSAVALDVRRIVRLDLRRLRVPLVTPYRLAFGPVEAFDTIIAEVELDDGARGLGEATILTGYTEETVEGSWAWLCAIAPRLCGQSVTAVQAHLDAHLLHNPFSVTAIASALEWATGSSWLADPVPGPGSAVVRVPILGLLNASEPEAIEREAEALIEAGFGTIKIKVGFDPERDARFVRAVQRAVGGRARIRVDANQGFDVAQGCRFAQALVPDDIELFEQPCAAGDWDAHLAVARVSPVPMMLDESIFGVDDIDRAAELGAAQFIKVKLMKLGRLDRLAAAIERIETRGMTAVLGNGVACDIGCWMEAAIASRLIRTAGEMNGFLKVRQSLLARPLTVERGSIVLQSGTLPELDVAGVDRVTRAARHFAVERAAS